MLPPWKIGQLVGGRVRIGVRDAEEDQIPLPDFGDARAVNVDARLGDALNPDFHSRPPPSAL